MTISAKFPQRLFLIFLVLGTPRLLASCPELTEEPLSPDVVAAFDSKAIIDKGMVQFKLKVTNCGADMDEPYTMHSKAFLVPNLDYSRRLAGQGLVLDSFASVLHLRRNQSTVLDVKRPLPTITAGKYFLAATINTRAAPIPRPERGKKRPIVADEFVPETSSAQLNNITHQMLDIGMLAAHEGARRSGKYDLYHEVTNASFNFGANTAMHGSRNILRIMEGDDQIPPRETWENTISARFIFMNMEKGTAYLGAYTNQEIDKVWTSISWRPELDAKGRNIQVDYYHNAPRIDHLEAGDYLLGVLLNVTDRFTLDSYPENNLDLTYIKVPPTGKLSMDQEVWLDLGHELTAAAAVSVLTPVKPETWKYEIEGQPDWLKTKPQPSDYGLNIELSAKDDAPLGIYKFKLKVSVPIAGKEQTISSTLVVIKPDGPILKWIGVGDDIILTPQSPNVRLEDRDGIRYLTINFALANTGSKSLLYRFSSPNGFTFETPENRVVAAGTQHPVRVTVPLVGLALPRASGDQFSTLFSVVTTNVGARTLTIKFNAKAMVEHH